MTELPTTLPVDNFLNRIRQHLDASYKAIAILEPGNHVTEEPRFALREILKLTTGEDDGRLWSFAHLQSGRCRFAYQDDNGTWQIWAVEAQNEAPDVPYSKDELQRILEKRMRETIESEHAERLRFADSTLAILHESELRRERYNTLNSLYVHFFQKQAEPFSIAFEDFAREKALSSSIEKGLSSY